MYIMAQNKESYRLSLKNCRCSKKYSGCQKPSASYSTADKCPFAFKPALRLTYKHEHKTIYIISSILLLVLILACINYMNMATAGIQERKEAGLRKVSGATNSNLVGQFLFESITMVTSAFIIALILSYLLMPLFVSMTGIPLNVITIWSISFFVNAFF